MLLSYKCSIAPITQSAWDGEHFDFLSKSIHRLGFAAKALVGHQSLWRLAKALLVSLNDTLWELTVVNPLLHNMVLAYEFLFGLTQKNHVAKLNRLVLSPTFQELDVILKDTKDTLVARDFFPFKPGSSGLSDDPLDLPQVLFNARSTRVQVELFAPLCELRDPFCNFPDPLHLLNELLFGSLDFAFSLFLRARRIPGNEEVEFFDLALVEAVLQCDKSLSGILDQAIKHSPGVPQQRRICGKMDVRFHYSGVDTKSRRLNATFAKGVLCEKLVNLFQCFGLDHFESLLYRRVVHDGAASKPHKVLQEKALGNSHHGFSIRSSLEIVNDEGAEEILRGVGRLSSSSAAFTEFFEVSVYEIENLGVVVKNLTDSVEFFFVLFYDLGVGASGPAKITLSIVFIMHSLSPFGFLNNFGG